MNSFRSPHSCPPLSTCPYFRPPLSSSHSSPLSLSLHLYSSLRIHSHRFHSLLVAALFPLSLSCALVHHLVFPFSPKAHVIYCVAPLFAGNRVQKKRKTLRLLSLSLCSLESPVRVLSRKLSDILHIFLPFHVIEILSLPAKASFNFPVSPSSFFLSSPRFALPLSSEGSISLFLSLFLSLSCLLSRDACVLRSLQNAHSLATLVTD